MGLSDDSSGIATTVLNRAVPATGTDANGAQRGREHGSDTVLTVAAEVAGGT